MYCKFLLFFVLSLDLKKMSETDELCGIGDRKSDYQIKPFEAAVCRKFPWRAFLLGGVRLAMCVVCLWHGSSQLVLRGDGKTTTKRIISNKYRYLKYSYTSNMVPVLMLSLMGSPELTHISTASAVGLLLAIIVHYIGSLLGYQRPTQGEINQKSFSSHVIVTTVTLTVFGLLFTAVDLVSNFCDTLIHAHLLLVRVGVPECAAFLALSTSINGILFYLWSGGLHFQKELIS
uniref:Uncharacterized protein n=1 Tax=Graphocephala atropunctata TaxID=36148 RepID=A0A1B6MDU7_9HEMI